ncbi:hypothetical protein [Candidatus Frankia alpina]|uniref:hypothetical protein n=1 Tax=Candidatus Frankia alpina TaxID=2699483 RepID=UPI001F1E4459|nr:hypothetical protein [Candidatus Frankia alpina]
MYEQHWISAERAATLLGLSLLDPTCTFTLADMAEVLVASWNGAAGKDFLGYRHDPDLLAALRRGVARLAEEGAVSTVGEGRLWQRPDVRRHLLAILAPAVPGPLATPGTLEVAEGGVEVNSHEVPSLSRTIEAAVAGAISRALPDLAGADPVVRSSDHADFHSNAALALARRARRKPADLAGAVADALRAVPTSIAEPR